MSIIDVERDEKTNLEGIWAADTVAGISVPTNITADHESEVANNIISELNGQCHVDYDIFKN
ncbi:hypothetical protein [Evansella tamaricis]|uniref:Uncharacterized protein n=1 Tax=Evansella tamaricis TaxID=2069301 RepID=A0ABS6JKX6_9BACI|nr:hypothetical protein [Evansella tamaricis]MBU9713482.1 hypothetical protein [Evansella tamaricis]